MIFTRGSRRKITPFNESKYEIIRPFSLATYHSSIFLLHRVPRGEDISVLTYVRLLSLPRGILIFDNIAFLFSTSRARIVFRVLSAFFEIYVAWANRKDRYAKTDINDVKDRTCDDRNAI